MVISLELGADLHMAQLMPLPLTVSCFSKIQIGYTFLVPAHMGSPGHRTVKRVCVCVCLLNIRQLPAPLNVTRRNENQNFAADELHTVDSSHSNQTACENQKRAVSCERDSMATQKFSLRVCEALLSAKYTVPTMEPALGSWASAHRGKWGQLTPWKMDEKLKSENMQKRAVFCVYIIF